MSRQIGQKLASLDCAHTPAIGEPLPAGWKWLFFNLVVRHHVLGADGYPLCTPESFLPPIDLPRRMGAGSRIRYLAPLPVGAEAERTSRIQCIYSREGKSGRMCFVIGQCLRDAALIPLVETAAGLDGVHTLAAAPGVVRLAIGHIDFVADLGIQCSEGEPEIALLRFAVAMVTRRHSLAPAIDGVTAAFQDDELLRQDTLRAVRYGFGAKLCIHPRQLAVVHAALMPAHEEVEWAAWVLQADRNACGTVLQLDGWMVDMPVVLQESRILARANAPTRQRTNAPTHQPAGVHALTPECSPSRAKWQRPGCVV